MVNKHYITLHYHCQLILETILFDVNLYNLPLTSTWIIDDLATHPKSFPERELEIGRHGAKEAARSSHYDDILLMVIHVAYRWMISECCAYP